MKTLKVSDKPQAQKTDGQDSERETAKDKCLGHCFHCRAQDPKVPALPNLSRTPNQYRIPEHGDDRHGNTHGGSGQEGDSH